MPVYNGSEFLRATIDSLLAQTFRDFELIISDNASTDATESICREYAARDSRIRYYRNPKNVGASDNYNAVFHYARARYFKWASSNDLCHPRFLEACVAVLDARPDVVLAFPRTRLLDSDGAPLQDYEEQLALDQASPSARYRTCLERMRLNNIMNGTIRSVALGKTSLIKKYFSSDCNLMAELALHGRFAEVPEYLYYRRMDPRTSTALKSGTEVVQHYDPARKRPMLFQSWKMNFARFGAARRAPITLKERALLTWYLMRSLLWERRYLIADVAEAGQSLFARARRRRG